MDCIFDQSFRVPGEDMPIKLDFSQVPSPHALQHPTLERADHEGGV
jgi:hypothetical protein